MSLIFILLLLEGEYLVSVKSAFTFEFEKVFLLLLANSVNTKCCRFKLMAIPFFKIIIDPPGQGAHCFVSYFIINIEQIIV